MFKAIGDIFAYVFVGGLLMMIIRYLLPRLVTGTTGTDNLMTYFWPLLLFFGILILCMFAFKRRRQAGGV